MQFVAIQILSYAEYWINEKSCTIKEKECLLKKKVARKIWRPGKFLTSQGGPLPAILPGTSELKPKRASGGTTHPQSQRDPCQAESVSSAQERWSSWHQSQRQKDLPFHRSDPCLAAAQRT